MKKEKKKKKKIMMIIVLLSLCCAKCLGKEHSTAHLLSGLEEEEEDRSQTETMRRR